MQKFPFLAFDSTGALTAPIRVAVGRKLAFEDWNHEAVERGEDNAVLGLDESDGPHLAGFIGLADFDERCGVGDELLRAKVA